MSHLEAKRTINNPLIRLQLDLSPIVNGLNTLLEREPRKHKAQLRGDQALDIFSPGRVVPMIDGLPSTTRIGLIDDDSSVRKAMSRLLRSRGTECVAYESAEAALADPELLRTDCLILDIELPEMNGFELRDHLIELGSPIPHLFVTAHSESDFADWNVRIKDSPYLRKPVNETQLIELIRELIAWQSEC